MAYELGLIRVDRGQFIDKGNYAYDPRHPDFSGGADPDGLRDARAAFADCDAAAVAAGSNGIVGPGVYRFASSVTLSAGWELSQGAVIKPDNGVTVTFAGNVRGMGDRDVTFDTSAGGTISVTGSEWFVGDAATTRVRADEDATVVEDENGDDALTVSSEGARGRLLNAGGSGLYATDAYDGMPGDGATDEQAALASLMASTMPATGGAVLLSLGTHVIGSSLTLSRDFIIPEGATLQPASGATLTVDGAIQAGRHLVFDLSEGGDLAGLGKVDTFYPEWFGAVADGVTGSYAAFLALVDAVNAKGGGTISFASYGTYEVEVYRTAANGNATFTFEDCVGLTLEGNGATVNHFGDFHRSATGEHSVNWTFLGCQDLTIRGLEVNGNVQDTTRDSEVLESSTGHGIKISGCTGVVLERVYSHHWNADGFYISADSRGATKLASRNVTLRSCRAEYNARQGMSIINLFGGTFESSSFSYTGMSAGSYTPHSPGAGVDVEPNEGTPDVDVQTGGLVFTACDMVGNRSWSFVSTIPQYVDDITLIRCMFDCRETSSGGAFALQCIRGEVIACTFLTSDDNYVELTSTGRTDTLTTYRNCDFYGAHRILFSVNVAPVVIDGARIIGEHASTFSSFAPYLNNNLLEIRNTYIFIPAAAHDGATYDEIVMMNVLRSERNTFDTDLDPSGGLFFATQYGSATIARDDKYPTDGAFRDRFNSAANAYPYGRLTTGVGQLSWAGLTEWKLGTAAPTTGTAARGNVISNITPSEAKAIAFWHCITAGTPGTWRAVGTGRGTTAQRPSLASGDAGYTYWDTDVGQIIHWNGSTWDV